MSAENGRVLGIGGIFVTSPDNDKLRAWYRDVLGVNITDYGAHFLYKDEPDVEKAYNIWGVFKDDTKYLQPSSKPFMINFRVDDLEAFLATIADKGVKPLGDGVLEESYGKFAWIMDPDGTKIELWQQIGPIPDGQA